MRCELCNCDAPLFEIQWYDFKIKACKNCLIKQREKARLHLAQVNNVLRGAMNFLKDVKNEQNI